jgi:DNA-binding transcriptional regulator YiaG
MVLWPAMEAADLKLRRLKLGLSQDKFARRIGVATGTVSGWEQARSPIPEWLEKMLELLEREQKKN